MTKHEYFSEIIKNHDDYDNKKQENIRTITYKGTHNTFVLDDPTSTFPEDLMTPKAVYKITIERMEDTQKKIEDYTGTIKEVDIQ